MFTQCLTGLRVYTPKRVGLPHNLLNLNLNPNRSILRSFPITGALKCADGTTGTGLGRPGTARDGWWDASNVQEFLMFVGLGTVGRPISPRPDQEASSKSMVGCGRLR